MPPLRHDHPVFTRVYGALAAVGEHTELARTRSEVLAPARGRLLVVGLGPGHDLEHVPASVTEVVAVEPSASMRRAAEARVHAARAGGLAVEVLDGVAEALPLPDASVDAVLFAFVLCSVDDLGAAVSEGRRVLRPDGVVGVLEHVAASDGSWTRRLQRVVAPVWPHLAGGCRADRDTRAALVAAGFDDTDLRDAYATTLPMVAPTLVGTVRPLP